MFSSDNNPFDPSKFAEMFKTADMTKMFDVSAFKGMDAGALMDAQKKNMDAMMGAQQAAAAGYQDLFEKQIAIFQETMAAAQAQVAEMSKASNPADAAEKQAEMTRKAYETALANVTELAELAQKANTEAFTIMQDRIQATIDDMMKR